MSNPIRRRFVSYTFTATGDVLLTDIGIAAINCGFEITNISNDFSMTDSNAGTRDYLKGQQDAMRRQSSSDRFNVVGDKISGQIGDVLEGEFWI